MLADGTQTIAVTPNATALVLETHVVIDIPEAEKDRYTGASGEREVDPVMLSIFGHRFMAIAEQMGRALQKTSVSTNVKERLDFSCAVFDAQARMVAQAAHIPVHLLGTCADESLLCTQRAWSGISQSGQAGAKYLHHPTTRARLSACSAF